MDKLHKLLSLCKCGVFLVVNEHRDYYQTAQQRMVELYSMECPPEIERDVYDEMIKTDTIIDLQFYPNTPIGSYSIYHYDLNSALDEALACLEENDKNQGREKETTE
jgi:hypothetical protein